MSGLLGALSMSILIIHPELIIHPVTLSEIFSPCQIFDPDQFSLIDDKKGLVQLKD